jgi:hypothetical protein
MKKIDIFNLPTYLRRTGDNKLARVGHVNYALEEIEKINKTKSPSDVELTAGSTSALSNIKKLDKSFIIGSSRYDVYSFQSWMVLTGVAAYVESMGLINVSTGPLLVTKQSTNIVANDTLGLGGFTNMAISNNSTLGEFDNTSTASPLDFAYINQDNGLTGVDDNYMFLILGTSLPLSTIDVEVYVDIEFVVEQGAAVEFINL